MYIQMKHFIFRLDAHTLQDGNAYKIDLIILKQIKALK